MEPTTTTMSAPDYYSTNVRERVSSMLQAGRWMDCKFLVGTEVQELVHGHKLILASASPVFDAMFFGEMAESQSPILVPDIEPAAFKTMLECIYTDNVILNTPAEVFNLYYTANKYILPNLEKLCISHIEAILDNENVCQAYEYLMDKCLDFIQKPNNTKDFLDNYLRHYFRTIKLSTLVTIFSLEAMRHRNALYFFDITRLYAEILEKHMESSTNCDTDCESSSQKSSECSMLNDTVIVNGEHKTKHSKDASLGQKKGTSPSLTGSKEKLNIRSLLEKIHFLTLTPQQFAEGPAKSSLLTESEVLAILMNIVSDHSHIPLPSGFSSYRRRL